MTKGKSSKNRKRFFAGSSVPSGSALATPMLRTLGLKVIFILSRRGLLWRPRCLERGVSKSFLFRPVGISFGDPMLRTRGLKVIFIPSRRDLLWRPRSLERWVSQSFLFAHVGVCLATLMLRTRGPTVILLRPKFISVKTPLRRE